LKKETKKKVVFQENYLLKKLQKYQALIELLLLAAMTDEDSPTLGSVKSTFKNIMTTVISSTDYECLFHY
jgi:hypothetical protein